ncbi:putative fatty acyl-CoA reductase CG5065 isoform X2 [Diaphorina citri]|uniref:Fatty acyl-CoA reductase n=1 Tax=Diaphorina citri TaxID=121845 RepID=A0A3Q0JFB6_DIACI|nr:putative fatty acyl-CoA reductase CG5065 isoform X1 [Diaphorina citri]XP_026685713.1 putative fatty acyl-CoA reductase CG5065 isoform X1 [Diaphorina citri]XP_026685714.1 putative fatty acyl-CoA reductase CG5065 isoform X2 [Diaphorina citri]
MALDLHKIAVKLEQDVLSQGAPGAPKLEMSEIVTAQYPIDPFELLGENSFGKPRVVPPDEVGSPIQEFYRGASVFVTGGTGFMGKTLTEKLLRACPHLERVYLLVRPKKGKTVSERLDELFEDRLFSRLKAEVPHFRSKISVVTGDVSLPGLGLSAADRAVLRRNVTVVFHGAATVRFDENIKVAIAINIFGVQAMLELAKEMKHLKSFVHVSTAYTHCPRQEIDEVFYPPPYDYKDFMELVMSRSDDNLEEFSRT